MKPTRSLRVAPCVLLATLVALAPPAAAEEPVGDIIVEANSAASADVIYAHLIDLRNHEALWPEGCTSKWEHGITHEGPGASAQLVYHIGSARRKLSATISKVAEGRRIDIDHPGRKGFVTTWTLTPGEGGTAIELHTWINPPPWPFKKAYFSRVKPVWQTCHQGAVDAAARVGG